MKIEIIGRGPLTPAQLDEILFGTSTVNRKNPFEGAMGKLINEVKREDEKNYKAPICFDIQSITANHKKNAFTVVWGDGSHTIVHLQPGDVWDDEKALAMCFVKHLMGDTGSFNDIFTEEMPAKIKHIGTVSGPTVAERECHCDTPRDNCSCHTTAERAAEASVNAVLNRVSNAAEMTSATLKKMIDELTGEPVNVQRYDLLLVEPDGTEKEICYNCTDGEIHKAMRAYRMKHYPILEANRTPYRVWQRDGALFVDFGAGSYFKVPGMEHDTFVKGK